MFQATAESKRVRGTAAAICGFMAFGLGLVPAGFVPKAVADTWDKKTVVTFNAPVEVPGKVLPPGTYVFKLLNSASNRNIVQIFDKDEKQLYATILGVPDYRLMPADKPVIQFEERPSNNPEAIKAWFYPDDVYGIQFVYPHDQAVKLAKRTKQNVLSMNNAMGNNMANATANSKTTANDPAVRALQNTEVTGVDSEGKPVDLTIVVATKPEK
jgi:hypothetical protein